MTMTKIKRLHPTLKACKCGFVGTRTMLYNHMATNLRILVEDEKYPKSYFFTKHGEVPLNEDDPRLAI